MIIFVGLVLCYGSLYYWPRSSDALEKGVTITIEKGSTFTQVTKLLHQKKIIQSRPVFYAYGRIQGYGHQMRAGQFHFQGSQSYHQVYQKLVNGESVIQSITFYEGMRATQMAGRLQQTLNVDSSAFMTWVQDPKYCTSLGIQSANLEGYLFPDTYYFPIGFDVKQVIEQMVARFREVVKDTLIEKALAQGFDLHDLLILASIVVG